MYDFLRPFLYDFLRPIFAGLIKLANRFRVIGRQNVPRSGPVILVANHVSYWDPLVLGAAIPRRIVFLAKASLFKVPVVGFFIKVWGAIPVRQGSTNRRNFKQWASVIQQGQVLGVFIEGTRNRNCPERMLKPQPGPAALALQTGAPVIPVALINTRKVLWGFRRVTVVFGQPMFFQENPNQARKELLAGIGQQLVSEILRLKNSL
ncbi:MAG: 1-acyl-sn-glycerol-3-phosphate acyltransferase [Firmicutes bacterium]|nr:1-acyl-sn-glycerol-3-phosphate acyltransferase [Bacillota bacterium]